LKRSRAVDLLGAVQIRCARVAVGPSSVRGQRAPGLVEAARVHLGSLDLRPLGVSRPDLFRRRLDRATERLARALPARGRSWGVSRKLLNIFLRDSFYTTYLCRGFRLDRAEYLFEIPLDSITARRLRAQLGRGQLPRWEGVKRVSQSINAEYRAAAVAAARDVARVHLDAFWWGALPHLGKGASGRSRIRSLCRLRSASPISTGKIQEILPRQARKVRSVRPAADNLLLVFGFPLRSRPGWRRDHVDHDVVAELPVDRDPRVDERELATPDDEAAVEVLRGFIAEPEVQLEAL